jgi:Growth inhibitor
MNKYIPEKGDIVWIDFDPSLGKEIQKRRPALVVSEKMFNYTTGFSVVCPITSSVLKLPTRHTLSFNHQIQGQVLVHQIKSLDYRERNISFVEKINRVELKIIEQLIGYIFQS